MRVVLLAGGKSKRMGTDKMFLPLQQKPLVLYMVEKLLDSHYLVSLMTSFVNEEKTRQIFPPSILKYITIFQDVYPDKGPIGGIYSGLYYSSEPYVFVLAADLPFFHPNLINYIETKKEGYDAVIPQTEKGYEPLFALYSQKCQNMFKTMIQANDLKISNAYENISKFIILPEQIKDYDPSFESFMNINTREDYEGIIRSE